MPAEAAPVVDSHGALGQPDLVVQEAGDPFPGRFVRPLAQRALGGRGHEEEIFRHEVVALGKDESGPLAKGRSFDDEVGGSLGDGRDAHERPPEKEGRGLVRAGKGERFEPARGFGQGTPHDHAPGKPIVGDTRLARARLVPEGDEGFRRQRRELSALGADFESASVDGEGGHGGRVAMGQIVVFPRGRDFDPVRLADVHRRSGSNAEPAASIAQLLARQEGMSGSIHDETIGFLPNPHPRTKVGPEALESVQHGQHLLVAGGDEAPVRLKVDQYFAAGGLRVDAHQGARHDGAREVGLQVRRKAAERHDRDCVQDEERHRPRSG